MHYKMTQKLVGYFAITLLVFAIIIGVTFSMMFRQSTLDQSRTDLEFRAKTIANSVSPYLESSSSNNKHGSMMRNRDLSTYLESLEASTVGEVWVVDKEMKSISRGQGHNNATTQLSDLPEDSERMIKQALSGFTVYSDGFSEMLNSESVTVGVPVQNGDGQIVGAVLVHSPIAGIDAVIQHGYHVLSINIAVALVLSVVVAYFLSIRFVRPLKRMSETSKALAMEDYTVQTNVHQHDEIGELAASIDTLAVRLNEASQARDRLDHMRHEFFADISHELKTPVTILRGSLEAMRDGQVETPEKREEYEENMLQEVIHLQKLINDLLDFSKLNTTDFVLEKDVVNLHDIVGDAIRSLRPVALQKAIEISYEKETVPFALYGDYARLRQMITIILDNAIKFSDPHATVTLQQKGDMLSITDTGKGIASEEIPHIFNRFYKDQGTHNELGNGIGLAIAQQIAKRHMIDIIVESVPHEETTFTFVLTHNRQDIDYGN